MCQSVRHAVRISAALLLAAMEVGALDPNRAVSQYQKTTWQVEDGLPQNAVRAIAQANDGNLLVGTTGDLIRFDGRVFGHCRRAQALTCLRPSTDCSAPPMAQSGPASNRAI